jgi:Phage endonuclease I
MPGRFRSRLEGRIAKWMEVNGLDYEYESLRLNYVIEATYTPDFLLPNGVMLEAKGFFRPEDRRKLLAVRKANPDADIRLVFQQPNNTLTKISKTTYGDWATKNGFPWCNAAQIPVEWYDDPPSPS